MNKPDLSQAIKNVLTDEFSDTKMKLHTIDLVKKNLLYKDVVSALVEALPKIKEGSVLNSSINVLQSLNLNELEDTQAYIDSLKEIFKTIKSEKTAFLIISEFERLIAIEKNIISDLLDSLTENASNEFLINKTLDVLLPKLKQQDAIHKLIKKGIEYPEYLQIKILSLLSNLKGTDSNLHETLTIYFDPKISEKVQELILRYFANQPKLKSDLSSHFEKLLYLELSESFKVSILNFVFETDNLFLNPDLLENLVTSDQSETVRAKAQSVLEKSTKSITKQKTSILQQIGEESSLSNRLSSLKKATNYIRDPLFRIKLLNMLLERSFKNLSEFQQSFKVFNPYLNRDEELRNAIWDYCNKSNSESKKIYIIKNFGENIQEQHYKKAFKDFYENNESSEIREACIFYLLNISLLENPEFKTVFIEEFREPSSPYRVVLLEKLSLLTEDSDVSFALEEIIQNEIDRMLIDKTSEIYLKSFKTSLNRKKTFFNILKNTNIDLELRKSSLRNLKELELNENEAKELSTYSAVLK